MVTHVPHTIISRNLSLVQEMHPLSVEDLLHPHGHTRSKADYYPKHLFIRILCHILGSTARSSRLSDAAAGSPAAWLSSAPITNLLRSSSPQRLDATLRTTDEGPYTNGYGDGVYPIADESETDKASPVDPEMGGRTASLLV
jgi:hypothetical protein